MYPLAWAMMIVCFSFMLILNAILILINYRHKNRPCMRISSKMVVVYASLDVLMILVRLSGFLYKSPAIIGGILVFWGIESMGIEELKLTIKENEPNKNQG